MSAERVLYQALDRLERELQAKKPRVERELAHVEAERFRLLAERDAILRAPERRARFNPMLGRGYQCPSCWINSETASRMRELPSANGDSLFLCDACGFRCTVEIDGK
jgi:hypothetical protein